MQSETRAQLSQRHAEQLISCFRSQSYGLDLEFVVRTQILASRAQTYLNFMVLNLILLTFTEYFVTLMTNMAKKKKKKKLTIHRLAASAAVRKKFQVRLARQRSRSSVEDSAIVNRIHLHKKFLLLLHFQFLPRSLVDQASEGRSRLCNESRRQNWSIDPRNLGLALFCVFI